jgi:CRP/FNR family transcriptional regulator, cyclic AMP receptor protein
MNVFDVFGYMACALVFLTFIMKEMAPLRLIALCSNIAFLVYGVGLDLKPVIFLHLALMPLNGWRLAQLIRQGSFRVRFQLATQPHRADGAV